MLSPNAGKLYWFGPCVQASPITNPLSFSQDIPVFLEVEPCYDRGGGYSRPFFPRNFTWNRRWKRQRLFKRASFRQIALIHTTWHRSKPNTTRKANTEEFFLFIICFSSPPSVCGACLFLSLSREGSAVPFPRRPWSRILCTHDKVALHCWV